MDRGSLFNLILLIGLILIQVLICNHIHIFNVAMPFVYIYVIIRLPMSMSTNWLLTWAFVSGFIVDLFSDTPGINSLACITLAIFKRPVLYAYIPKDDRTRDILPSIANMGMTDYAKYMFTLVLIYCMMIFGIEYLSLSYVKNIIVMGLSSTLLSGALIMGIDSLIVTKHD
ncbi:MAG: rod shape-determining protein MreD [Muribaculaceae bacterium]|nr:rod shape-determining protein MreD [Muribaculaceae bacterium]